MTVDFNGVPGLQWNEWLGILLLPVVIILVVVFCIEARRMGRELRTTLESLRDRWKP